MSYKLILCGLTAFLLIASACKSTESGNNSGAVKSDKVASNGVNNTVNSSANTNSASNSNSFSESAALAISGDYNVVSARVANKCLDRNETGNGLTTWGCVDNSKLNQKFTFELFSGTKRFFRIHNYVSTSNTNMCVDIAKPDDLKEVMWTQPCDGANTKYQKWEVIKSSKGENWYQIKNAETGNCMSISDVSGGDNVHVVQGQCDDSDNKDMWILKSL